MATVFHLLDYSISSGWHIIATCGFVSVLGFNLVILDPSCELVFALECFFGVGGWVDCVENNVKPNE